MKSSRIILRAFALVAAAAAVAFASLYFLTEPATSRATVKKSVVAQPCGDRIFGHVTSLARKGDHLELRFDPAWFTSGLTANDFRKRTSILRFTRNGLRDMAPDVAYLANKEGLPAHALSVEQRANDTGPAARPKPKPEKATVTATKK